MKQSLNILIRRIGYADEKDIQANHKEKERYGVDYDLPALMMRREVGKESKLHIRWDEQMVA